MIRNFGIISIFLLTAAGASAVEAGKTPPAIQTNIGDIRLGARTSKTDTNPAEHYQAEGGEVYSYVLYGVVNGRIDHIFGSYSDDIAEKISFKETIQAKEKKFGKLTEIKSDDTSLCPPQAIRSIKDQQLNVTIKCNGVAIWEDDRVRFVMWDYSKTINALGSLFFYNNRGIGIFDKKLTVTRQEKLANKAQKDKAEEINKKKAMQRALESE